MDKSIHYYGIGFLARAAGFNRQHALTIAYASQYVDSATEGEPIRVGDTFFDPVRTAHYGLKAFDWGVQKKIFIPFHFIPARPFDPDHGPFSFVTAANSPFANMVFRQACRASRDETSRLIGIGIALHTLADSWSHDGFSGKADPLNDVESIQLFRDGAWKHLLLENIYLDIMPKIGHAQAGYYPDDSYLRWKYVRDATKTEIVRDNPAEYAAAAETMYRLLAATKKLDSAPALPWKEIESSVLALLADPEANVAKRCGAWRSLYKSVFGEARGFDYDPLQWRQEALGGDVAWDDFRQTEFRHLAFAMKTGFYETRWVKFHRAALRQRNFVLERLL